MPNTAQNENLAEIMGWTKSNRQNFLSWEWLSPGPNGTYHRILPDFSGSWAGAEWLLTFLVSEYGRVWFSVGLDDPKVSVEWIPNGATGAILDKSLPQALAAAVKALKGGDAK